MGKWMWGNNEVDRPAGRMSIIEHSMADRVGRVASRRRENEDGGGNNEESMFVVVLCTLLYP